MKFSPHHISNIVNQYSVGKFKNRKLLYDQWNTAYKVQTTKGTYIVKILVRGTLRQFLQEVRVIRRLQKKIPVRLPIISKNSKLYVKIRAKNKSYNAYITPYIRGNPLRFGEKLSPKNLLIFGTYFAHIHKTSTKGIVRKNTFADIKKLFRRLPDSTDEKKVATRVFSLLKNHKFNHKRFPAGLIHADLHTENIIMHKNKIACVLDFEHAHIGPFILDLGVTFLDTCYKNGALSKERIRIFFKGYESIRKLTIYEKAHITDAVIFAGLYYLHFAVIKSGTTKKNLQYYWIKRFLQLLKKEETNDKLNKSHYPK